jgi:predicted aconitase with swiveling domain
LLRNGKAPAALVLGRVDAILGLGILAAAEMGWNTIPLLVLPLVEQRLLPMGASVEIDASGIIEFRQ